MPSKKKKKPEDDRGRNLPFSTISDDFRAGWKLRSMNLTNNGFLPTETHSLKKIGNGWNLDLSASDLCVES